MKAKSKGGEMKSRGQSRSNQGWRGHRAEKQRVQGAMHTK